MDISGNGRDNAALIVNQTGSRDILTASSSGTTRFAIENDGTVQLDTTKYANCDGLNVDSTGNLQCGAIMKRKAATEGVTGSTALQDDDELTFSIGANETWIVKVNYLYTTAGVATNDIRVGLNNTGTSPTCDYSATDTSHAGNMLSGETTACNTAIVVATTQVGEKGGILTGTVTTGGGSGTVAFRWAQGTNDAVNATTVEIGSSLMAWKINGADLAEVYYSNAHLTPGTVLTLDPSIDAGVQRSSTPYANNMVGVVTTRPGKVLGDSTRQGTGIPTMVALSGRVPVYVSSENGQILPGDPLTSSSTPGVAMKATGAGNIIGIAMTGFDGTQLQGQVNMFIKSGYYDPAGQFVTYDATSNRLSLGQGTESVDIASDLTIAGSISGAGLTDCRAVGSRLIYNGETATFGCVESLSNQMESSNMIFEGLGDITLQKEEVGGDYVVLDGDGNAINKSLAAKSIKTGIVEAGKVIADEIIGKVADITSLKSTDLTSDTAVITGTLTSKEVSTGLLSLAEYEIAGDEILSFRGKTGQDLVKIDPAGNVEIKGDLKVQNIVANNVTAATVSATTLNATEAIISKLRVKDLEFENIINNSSTSAILTVADEITSDLGKFKFLRVDTDLLVLGTTTLSDAAIENDLVVGGDLTIGANSLNTTTTELAIQPLALQAIDLMAGAVRIETDGTLLVRENAVFAKDVEIQGVLSANTIRGIGDTLEVSGSARFENAEFGQVKVTPKDVEILSDTEVISNSTAGKLKLKAGETLLKVFNDKVTRDSLIFITPRRAIAGPSLFTDTQVEGQYFIVEIPIAPTQDIEFNYLIVN